MGFTMLQRTQSEERSSEGEWSYPCVSSPEGAVWLLEY